MKHATSIVKVKIKMSYDAGMSIAEISNVFGYHRNTISRWLKQAESDPEFQTPRKSGTGREPALSIKSVDYLIKAIKKPATEYGYNEGFWTLRRIQEVCLKHLGVKVSKTSLFYILKKKKQSFKKPEKRYYEASKVQQQIWTQDALPKIIQRQADTNGIIYFLDESTFQLSSDLRKTWGPIGETSKQAVTGNRGSVSAISVITKEGDLYFNIFDSGKRFSADDVILFLRQMVDYHKGQHVIVLMDQAQCHTAKKVQRFILNTDGLDVFYLPPRSPEYNPMEKVWNSLKNREMNSHPARTSNELKDYAIAKMAKMAKNKNLVKASFMRCPNYHLYM